MLKFFKDFFHFSNSEMKGIFVLLVLIIISFLIPRAYFYFKKAEIVNNLQFTEWLSKINIKEDSIIAFQKQNNSTNNEIETNIEYFSFDPNTVSHKKMVKLGIDSKTASILIKYRNKGAKFYTKKDLLRIYGFSENLYSKLENYIIFPEKNQKKFNNYAAKDNKKQIIEYFPFDPNTVTYKEMIKLGIDGKTANIIIKFRKGKTVFYSKEDLLKVYGFTEEKYLKLEDLIQFPEKEIKAYNKEKNEEKEFIIVNLNLADETELKKLKGIGAFRAKEIIKHRKQLGGFYSTEQLKEIYGVTDEVIHLFKNNIIISSIDIKKINLNTATFKILIQHPYIDKELTIKILNLKQEIGGFNKIEDLIYYNTLKQAEFEKLKNYFYIEN